MPVPELQISENLLNRHLNVLNEARYWGNKYWKKKGFLHYK